MKIRNLFRIHGGKTYLAKWIISHFPPHKKYVEACLGAGTVFYNKPYVPSTLYETNPDIYLIHKHLNYIQNEIKNIKCSPELFTDWKNKTPGKPEEKALREYILRKMSRVGDKQTFSKSARLRGGRPEIVNCWENSKDLSHFLSFSPVLKNQSFFSHSFDEDTLVYVDPPYLHETRATKTEYGPHEWTPKQHLDLINLAKSSPGLWFISGYPNELYGQLGWKQIEKKIPNHSSQLKKKPEKVECIWTNV